MDALTDPGDAGAADTPGAPGADTRGAPGPPGRALVFIGFMGSGKSTAARDAAAALGARAVDSDRVIEQRLGHSVAEEFARNGEAAFRAHEERVALELLAGAGAGTVLALGGGSVLSPRVRAALRAHVTVLLDIDPAVAWERVGRAGGARAPRPLARDRRSFLALAHERAPLYASVADAILPVPSLQSVRRSLPAVRLLAAATVRARLLWATSASGDYPVFVGAGLLGSGLWPVDVTSSRGFCVSDENVARLYGGRLAWAAGAVAISPGEHSKTLASAAHVWEALLDAEITRADHVIALGGGVVGDLAGFCAATFQRGIGVVHVPTTLVAQVDSAYGGKTGVDLPRAKNYVGAYHQPRGVIADPAVLDTLPPAERAAGYAEVIKTALIAGGELWQRVSAEVPLDERMIVACVRTKLAVVAADERDAGRRQVLNLGHTVAHAIETVTGYQRYRHGEAVGLGLLAALRLSGQPRLRSQVAELLARQGLPTRLTGVSVEDVVAATLRDKKRLGATVPFVLVDAPGDVRTGAHVPAAELRAAVSELLAP